VKQQCESRTVKAERQQAAAMREWRRIERLQDVAAAAFCSCEVVPRLAQQQQLPKCGVTLTLALQQLWGQQQLVKHGFACTSFW
jgi:hypothetical protein